MSLLIIVLGIAAAVGVCLWFFVAHTPEQAASHEPSDTSAAGDAPRSHFAPGDPGTEDQALPARGEPGPTAHEGTTSLHRERS